MASTFIVDQGGSGDFLTIQAAVDSILVNPGDTIIINSGTYNESVSVTKALSFQGDSSGGPVVVTPPSGSAFAVAGDLGAANVLSFDNIEFRDATRSGIEFGAGDVLGTLKVTNSIFEANQYNGIEVVDGAGLANAVVTDSSFTGNGQPGSSSGDGDILFFQYNGDALLKNLNLTGQDRGTGAGENGIQFRSDTGSMGQVVLLNIAISGEYEKQPIAIFNYDDVDGLRMKDVAITAESNVFNTAINFDGIGGNIDFANPWKFWNVDVSGAGADDFVALQGAADDNFLRGGNEANFIRGDDGNDTMIGGGGPDTLYGQDGNDLIYGDQVFNGYHHPLPWLGFHLAKGWGFHHKHGSDDILSGGLGDDTMNGGGGKDTALYEGTRDTFDIGVKTNHSGLVVAFKWTDDLIPNLNGDEGVDQLSNIEVLQFADVTLDLTDPVQLFDTSGALVGTFDNLKDAVEAAEADYKIVIGKGKVDLADSGDANPGQIVIDKNLTIVGQGQGKSVIQAVADTGASGDARGMFLVQVGVTLDVADLTVDGDGHLIFQGFRHMGSGTFDNVEFTDIQYNAGGPNYAGTAIAVFGGGPGQNVDVSDSSFSDIGRVGVLYFGEDVSGRFEHNTYTGKGAGDFLDYALDIGAGADIEVYGNKISNNLGVASSDGSTSAAILITTFFGAGTEADIGQNKLYNNTVGIAVGFDENDTSAVNLGYGNKIKGGEYGLSVVGDGTVDGVDQLKGPGANVAWDGGAAGNVINGGKLADELFGNDGNDTMDGHWGNDTMDGGTGNDNITGGWGKDLFVFGLDSGEDTIEDFMNGKDLIDVSAYAAIQDVNDFAGLSESGGNVVIDIDGVNTITLVDTSLAEINNSDFLFA